MFSLRQCNSIKVDRSDRHSPDSPCLVTNVGINNMLSVRVKQDPWYKGSLFNWCCTLSCSSVCSLVVELSSKNWSSLWSSLWSSRLSNHAQMNLGPPRELDLSEIQMAYHQFYLECFLFSGVNPSLVALHVMTLYNPTYPRYMIETGVILILILFTFCGSCWTDAGHSWHSRVCSTCD